MFYSKSTNSFYIESVHGESIPSDAVEIDVTLHKKMVDARNNGMEITSDENGFPKIVERTGIVEEGGFTLDEVLKNKLRSIDFSAGLARSRFISPGEGILQEYQRAYEQATAFKTSGYTGQPPSVVADNMRYKDLSAQAAADDIIAEGDALNLVLDSIRSIRLDGKAAVSAAVEGDDIEAIAQPFIDQLETIKP